MHDSCYNQKPMKSSPSPNVYKCIGNSDGDLKTISEVLTCVSYSNTVLNNFFFGGGGKCMHGSYYNQKSIKSSPSPNVTNVL